MDPLNTMDHGLIEQLAGRYGLPLHVIFTDRIARNAGSFREVIGRIYENTLVCFAVKANPCRGAVRFASSLDIGLDAVSEFELQAGLEEGIDPDGIVCNGNAKSDRYIETAVGAGALIAADSDWELKLVSEASGRLKRRAPVLLRFAGMALEGLTASDQSTAVAWTKFGFPVDRAEEVIKQALAAADIDPVGISAHIGTQICDERGYDRLMEYLLDLGEHSLNLGMNLKYIDIGGGFPVSYLEHDEWLAFQARLLEQLDGRLPPERWVTWDNIPMGFREYAESNRAGGVTPQWKGKAYWSGYPGARMLEHLLERQTSTGRSVRDRLHELGSPTLIIEPGRALIGTAGVTAAKVSGVKEVSGNHVVVLELGIVNHGVMLVTADIFPVEVYPRLTSDRPVDAFLAGRLCFTGDMISKVKVRLNRLPRRGDLLIIHHTGAYAADHFASNSCGFPLPAKVAVHKDGAVEVWRRAERFEDVFGGTICS